LEFDFWHQASLFELMFEYGRRGSVRSTGGFMQRRFGAEKEEMGRVLHNEWNKHMKVRNISLSDIEKHAMQ